MSDMKDTKIWISRHFDQNAGQVAEIQGKIPIWWADNPVPEHIYNTYIHIYIYRHTRILQQMQPCPEGRQFKRKEILSKFN